MSAPSANTWDEVPLGVQEQVRSIYGALVNGALAEDGTRAERGPHYYSAGLFRWEFVPDRMKTAMANMLMAQRHETNRAITACFQSIMGDVVHQRRRE